MFVFPHHMRCVYRRRWGTLLENHTRTGIKKKKIQIIAELMFALIFAYVWVFAVVKKYRKCVPIKRLYTQWNAVSWLNKWKRGAGAELWYMTMEVCERFYLFAGTHPTYSGSVAHIILKHILPQNYVSGTTLRYTFNNGISLPARYLYSAYYPYQCIEERLCVRYSCI